MYGSRYLRFISSQEFVIGAAVLVAIGVVAALFYDFGFYTPSILQRGSVTVASRKDPTNRLTAATRLIAIRRQFWQVEYPVGVWNDCHQSCGETLRKAAFND
jgi:hypothetical protein